MAIDDLSFKRLAADIEQSLRRSGIYRFLSRKQREAAALAALEVIESQLQPDPKDAA